MYFTLPPGRAIRTGNSRVDWLALLTFLSCTVWPCRCNRRHALCILIAWYFHERTGTGTWVWPAGALIAITTSTSATTYTTQRVAPLYKNAKNQYKCHLSNYITTLSPLNQFHPYSTLTISPTQTLHYKDFHLHFNSTSAFPKTVSYRYSVFVSFFPNLAGYAAYCGFQGIIIPQMLSCQYRASCFLLRNASLLNY